MFENLPVSSDFKNQIDSSFNSGRLSHALIFEGSCEDTRLSAAIELSKALLCEAKLRPCGVCSSCMKIASKSHPDLHIIEKAQNALLKIFEEPQSHVVFILTCPSKAALLETVISRATSYSLGEEFSKDNSEKAALAKEKANELLSCFISENELSFIRKTAEFQKDKQFFIEMLKQLSPIVRDAVVFQNGSKDFLSDYPDTARKLSSVLTAKKAMELYSAVSELIENAERSANHNLTLTRLSSKLYNIKNR